jgi:hypothetical protein
MSIQTVGEAIEELQRVYGNALETNLVITWWDYTDFEDMANADDAMQICEDALDICIGHVNDTVWANAKMKEEESEDK